MLFNDIYKPLMQNTQTEMAYLRAPLSNGLQVLVQCERIGILRKCFLRGRVQKRKYRITVLEPLGIACDALYRSECYVAKWWWKFIFDDEGQAATAIHLIRLKTRFERFKLKQRVLHCLT